jgi:hypothetical protein
LWNLVPSFHHADFAMCHGQQQQQQAAKEKQKSLQATNTLLHAFTSRGLLVLSGFTCTLQCTLSSTFQRALSCSSSNGGSNSSRHDKRCWSENEQG